MNQNKTFKILKRQHYTVWPGLDASSDGEEDETFGKLNMQVQLQFGKMLDGLGINPIDVAGNTGLGSFVRGGKELRLNDLEWNELLKKLGFSGEGK